MVDVCVFPGLGGYNPEVHVGSLPLFSTIVFDTESLSKPGAHHFVKVPSWQVLGPSCT